MKKIFFLIFCLCICCVFADDSAYFSDQPSTDALHKNPFEPLVEKPQLPASKPVIPDKKTPWFLQPPPVIPPLNIEITGIVISGSKRQVLLRLEGQFFALFQGDTVVKKFKVVEITENSVTIFEMARQARRTITL